MKHQHLAAAVAVAMTVAACSEINSPVVPESAQSSSATSQYLPIGPDLHTTYLMMAEQAPSFAGFHYTEGGESFVVQMSSDSDTDIATRIARDFLFNTGRNAEVDIKTRIVQYSAVQLLEWLQVAARVLEPTGALVTLGLHEPENQLVVGLKSAESGSFEELLASAGIPIGAVSLIEATDITFESDITSGRRPIDGGRYYQFQGNNRASSCSLTANVKRNAAPTIPYALVASHCTDVPFSPSSVTYYYQPTISPINYFGYEALDPAPSAATCTVSSASPCRWADAALVQYDGASGDFGKIARTYYGSTTIDPAIQQFTLVGAVGFPLTNETLNKVGASTGWSDGVVQYTCTHLYNATFTGGGSVTLLCQDWINYWTQIGDSGAPVFNILQSGSRFYGVHSGGGTIGHQQLARFSNTSNIARDLGTLTYN